MPEPHPWPGTSDTGNLARSERGVEPRTRYLAIGIMPRTILCQKCGIVLNLPDHVTPGKRMKCPKCAHRFAISEKDASSESTTPGVIDAASLSSRDFGKRPPSHDDLPIPLPGRDLRDMFELPLGTGASIEKAAVSGQEPGVSDAEALFLEEPARRRKPKGAEARAKARRCASCGGVVPAGMSICVTCGLDQETGIRAGLDDDLAPPPPLRPRALLSTLPSPASSPASQG